MKNLRLIRTITLLLAGMCAPLAVLHAQGSLTPPAGPPAATMKALGEIEPRTNLQAFPAPPGVVTSDPSYHFIINQPGSYYLSANLDVTKQNGIRIIVEGVVLDLNGFRVSRTSGAGGSGIQINQLATATGSTVRNGTISGFSTGILGARASAFRNLVISGCSLYGIDTTGSTIDGVRVHQNGTGIWAEDGSILVNCTASNNSVRGFLLSQSTASNCMAIDNAGTGIVSAGGKVAGCHVTRNAQSGISVSGSGSEIIGNRVRDNNTGAATTHAGIVVNASHNRVEANHVTASGYSGIRVASGSHNVIIRNTVSGNAADNYVTPGIQVVGPIITTTGTITSANPWANFSY